jgi:hypothetical protein
MAGASALVVAGTWTSYLAAIPRGTVPERPTGSVLLQWAGIGLALGAIGWSVRATGSVGVAVLAPAAFALMMAAFFLWLLTQRETPIGDLAVKVGDPLLPFEATASDGTPFHSRELAGKRTLLKFFRGGW